jgi:hypothetical protein
MGLDMYLRAEKYVSGYGLKRPAQADDEARDFKSLLDTFAVGGSVREAATEVKFPSARVQFTVAYWRKANQIHSWFVRECQDNVDECQLTYVSREKLRELRETCLRVLVAKDESVAEELLAPKGGFFFGPAVYDEWYWEDLKQTVTQLDRVLALPDDWGLYYQSSW